MTIALKDIKGLMVGKKKYSDGDLRSDDLAIGFSLAINDMSERKIGLNREKLARTLHFHEGINSKPEWADKAWELCRSKEMYYKLADAIIANESTLIEYKE